MGAKTKLTVKLPFHIDTTKAGSIDAKAGDALLVEDKDAEHYYVKRLNEQNIYSRWMRKNWILSHCEPITTYKK